MSGIDADGSTALNEDGRRRPPITKPSFHGESNPLPPIPDAAAPRQSEGGTKISVVGVLGIAAIIAGLGVLGYEAKSHFRAAPAADTASDIVVAFTADPDVKNDAPIQLGYPNHRYSVTCAATGSKECVLEVDVSGANSTTVSHVKRFPYVEQEWFSPGRHNRPYHTLDVIYSLPSMNGNSELRFGTDTAKNAALVSVMRKNGWISE